jgi:aminoglycoside 3-N-acetyltransferase
MERLVANSGVLYVRASLRPLSEQIKSQGSFLNFLETKIDFSEIMAPHFYGSRPFWRKRQHPNIRQTNSGALGTSIRKIEGSALSMHPSHAFVGIGPQVSRILQDHNQDKFCFAPIQELVEECDFSMLLIGCLNESPGFSTVHASQELLGLTRLHLERYLYRWDFADGDNLKTKIAPESPGCSRSFHKFYQLYRDDNNLISGDWEGISWIYIQSARNAMKVECEILTANPRFVNCGNLRCTTCSLRLY